MRLLLPQYPPKRWPPWCLKGSSDRRVSSTASRVSCFPWTDSPCGTECGTESRGPGQRARRLQRTQAAQSRVGQPSYNPSSWFPSCVTLARPGTSLSLCFVICRWANGVVMRVEQVTPGALGRTAGTNSVTPGGLGLPGLVQSPCGSPSPPWLLPSFPAGLRRARGSRRH